jgi:hypothetical protein
MGMARMCELTLTRLRCLLREQVLNWNTWYVKCFHELELWLEQAVLVRFKVAFAVQWSDSVPICLVQGIKLS